MEQCLIPSPPPSPSDDQAIPPIAGGSVWLVLLPIGATISTHRFYEAVNPNFDSVGLGKRKTGQGGSGNKEKLMWSVFDATPDPQPGNVEAIILVKLLSEGWRLWIDVLPGHGDIKRGTNDCQLGRINSRGLSFVSVRPEEHELNQRQKDPNEQRKCTTTCERKCASSTESVRSLIPPFLSTPARWSINVSASLSIVGVRPKGEGELQLGYTPVCSVKPGMLEGDVAGSVAEVDINVEISDEKIQMSKGNAPATRKVCRKYCNEWSSNRVWDTRMMFWHVPRRTLKIGSV
ncbi:hypothetical protein EDB89DRAFT_1916201 [Lactarius sanguifluus]|nr:hypothetical protein EDB89DRAFT_1916201 [Lactarius sanguifluus]